jgi:hypothetical protein
MHLTFRQSRWTILLGIVAMSCGGKTMTDEPAAGGQGGSGALGSGGMIEASGGTSSLGGGVGTAGSAGSSVGTAGGAGGSSASCPAAATLFPTNAPNCAPGKNVAPVFVDLGPTYPADAIPSGACNGTEPTCIFVTAQLCPPTYDHGPRQFFSCSCVAGSWCCPMVSQDASVCNPSSCGSRTCTHDQICVHHQIVPGTNIDPFCAWATTCWGKPQCSCLLANICWNGQVCGSVSGADVMCVVP